MDDFIQRRPSHTGRPLLAQRLPEGYPIPYTSLGHLKMGPYRSGRDCGLTPADEDNQMSARTWGLCVGGLIPAARPSAI